MGNFVKNIAFNYYFLHIFYYVSLIVLSSYILFRLENEKLTFVDSLFTCTSAIGQVGLIVIETSKFNVNSQTLIVILILLGNPIIISILPLLVKINKYRKKLKQLIFDEEERYKIKLNKKENEYLVIIILFYFVVIVSLGAIFFLFALKDKNLISDKKMTQFKIKNYSENIWFSLFYTISGFSNAGFTLLNDSLVALNENYLAIFVQMILIVLGNFGFPIFLRIFIEFLICNFTNNKTFQFINQNTRFLYSHLLSASDCVKLFLIFCFITISQWMLISYLDWDNMYIFSKHYSNFDKLFNELFQSISTRNCGLYSIHYYYGSNSVLFVYMIFMLLSAFPLVISIRNSNKNSYVAEQKNFESFDLVTNTEDLSSTSDDGVKVDVAQMPKLYFLDNPKHRTVFYFIKEMIYYDFLVIIVVISFISFFEYDKFAVHNDQFSLMKIIFEVISGYGSVGLSLEVNSISYSALFSSSSKIVMMFAILFGRLRVLPHSNDAAITGEISYPLQLPVNRSPVDQLEINYITPVNK